ncbi:MAG: hypothetical protein IPI58_09145 [Alphaproteobacteria bacterium]|nr:MAG: hypothetical protein IPI58_09145 [Alphaproteobacteria bacterium]
MLYSWFEQFADMSFSEILIQILTWVFLGVVALTVLLLIGGVSQRQSKFNSSAAPVRRRVHKTNDGAGASGTVSLSQPVAFGDLSGMPVKDIKHATRAEATQPKSTPGQVAKVATGVHSLHTPPIAGANGEGNPAIVGANGGGVEPKYQGRSGVSAVGGGQTESTPPDAGVAQQASSPSDLTKKSGGTVGQTEVPPPSGLGIPGIPEGRPGLFEQAARDAQAIKDSGSLYGLRGQQAKGFFDQQRIRMMRFRVIDELLNMRSKIMGEIEMKRQRQIGEIEEMRRKFVSEKAEIERRLENDISDARRRIDRGDKS